MSIDYGFPQPTEADLEADVMFWLSFNPFWWKIVQGQIRDLAVPALWDDYTEEVDQAVLGLMVPHDLPECPECPPIPDIWVHDFDFSVSNQGFTVASGSAAWAISANGSVWQGGTSGSNRMVHIKRTMAARKIRGVSMLFDALGGTIRTAEIILLNPATNTIYSNSALPSSQGQVVRQYTALDNVTEAQVKVTVNNTGGSANIRRVSIWGEGTTPF